MQLRDLPEKKPYVVGLRVVQTKDFLTAEVSEVPWATLYDVAEEIIRKCTHVSTIYYDVTPKVSSNDRDGVILHK